jgi:hypothetical protein
MKYNVRSGLLKEDKKTAFNKQGKREIMDEET